MTKLLTIDDELEFTNLIRSYFTPRGFEVLVANHGDDGVAMAQRERPEVCLIDLKMPGLHGDEVLKRIKEMHPSVKPIMITAFQDDDGKTKNHIMSIGVCAYFEKPIASMRKLEETIKEALSLSSGPST